MFLRVQWTSICRGYGLIPNKHKAVVWTNAGLGWWHIYAPLGPNELHNLQAEEKRNYTPGFSVIYDIRILILNNVTYNTIIRTILSLKKYLHSRSIIVIIIIIIVIIIIIIIINSKLFICWYTPWLAHPLLKKQLTQWPYLSAHYLVPSMTHVDTNSFNHSLHRSLAH